MRTEKLYCTCKSGLRVQGGSGLFVIFTVLVSSKHEKSFQRRFQSNVSKHGIKGTIKGLQKTSVGHNTGVQYLKEV